MSDYDLQGYDCIVNTLIDTNGEVFQVGKDNIQEILGHAAQGEGDKWYYDVFYENGTVYRCFNPQGVKMIRKEPF